MSNFTKNLKKLKIKPRGKVFNIFVGNYKSIFRGQGLEFDDLRNYVPGDNVKDIDWNATAKTGELYVKKYIETRELNIYFAIDVSSSMNWGTNTKYRKSDIVTNLLYILGLAASKSNDRMGAIFFNDKFKEAIEFKKGRVQTLRILRTTQKMFNKNYFNSTDINKLLDHLLFNIKKKCVCFLVTDNIEISNERTQKLLRAVNQKHDLIVVLVNDTQELSLDMGGEVNIQDIETGEVIAFDFNNNQLREAYYEELQKETQALNRFLKKNGIGEIRIDQNKDILRELIKYFKMQEKLYRH